MWIGVDVGSSNTRAVLLDDKGTTFESTSAPLDMESPKRNFFEQSSDQIWDAVCKSVKDLLQVNSIDKKAIKGISFDATCSLVFVNKSFSTVAPTPDRDEKWNIIMWMDHRAVSETALINETKHPASNVLGGKISVEMQPPKILWVKRNNPEVFHRIGHFMDLTDWLTWKASGQITRSLCTVVSKWLHNSKSWDGNFWQAIGLEEFVAENFSRCGIDVAAPGTAIGPLTPESTQDLGLTIETVVGVGIIDAHSGLVGSLGASLGDASASEILFMIAGTSTCHLALAAKPVFVPGVWGPYPNAIIPGFWNAEAGQNCVAPVLDMVVEQFGYWIDAADKHEFVRAAMDQRLLSDGSAVLCHLGANIDVIPDYHGNRSPAANADFRGLISGLRYVSPTDKHERMENLLQVYTAHLQAFALQTRQIVEIMTEKGYPPFRAISMTGGLSKNKFYVQAHADALQIPVIVSQTDQAVARGAAILAAKATAENNLPLESLMLKFAPSVIVVKPDPGLIPFYETKLERHKMMVSLQQNMFFSI